MSQRILLIMPEFYGMERKIKSCLEESGNMVVWIKSKELPFDYHGTKAKLKFLRKLYFFFLSPQISFIKCELNKIENLKFDILISINCHLISNYLFKILKSNNPRIYSVAYLWDSFSMYSFVRELKFFDKVYTFDQADSERYKIDYKPNFYISNQQNLKSKIEYELFFVGKFSPARFRAVKTIINQANENGIKYFIQLWPAYKKFLHNHYLYQVLRKISFSSKWTNDYVLHYEANERLLDEDFIIENRLDFDDYQYQLQCSNVVLDLPFEKQSGITHRVIAALACGKKVITTNAQISSQQFFNPDQIQIFNENRPILEWKWIKERISFPGSNYFSELELSAWLKSILDVKAA